MWTRWLRRILSSEGHSRVPSEATFNHAFGRITSRAVYPDECRAALIERSLGKHIVGVIARDAREIEAHKGAVERQSYNDGEEGAPPPDGAQPSARRRREAHKDGATAGSPGRSAPRTGRPRRTWIGCARRSATRVRCRLQRRRQRLQELLDGSRTESGMWPAAKSPGLLVLTWASRPPER